MGLQLHKRFLLVRAAKTEIEDVVWKLFEAHDLTYVEMLQILTDINQVLFKYMLREERHPNDPDKKGDEA